MMTQTALDMDPARDAIADYLTDMTEQLAQLARNEGLTQAAAYLALASLSLRHAPAQQTQRQAVAHA